MNTKFTSTLSVAVLTGIVFAGSVANVHAADFKYNYVEGTYESIDLDGTDANVALLAGSYDITPNLNVIGEYATGNIDNPSGGSDLDYQEAAIGLGYHTQIAPKTDFTANVKVVNQDTDLAGDDTGYSAGIGLRHMLVDKIEVDADIDYIDVNNDEDTRLKVGARYYINDTISAGVGYSTSDKDVDTVSGNLRWNF